MKKFLIGVDEAGRGPLAGPVAVGVVSLPFDFDWKLIEGVNDSKKLTEKNREAIFLCAKKLQKLGKLDFAVSMVSASVIDRIGIMPALNLAIERALSKVTTKNFQCVVKLDGGLKAPKEFKNQETIIRGDSKEKVIGLASIMAKVTRDRYMVQIASRFEPYNLAIHKGYGTKKHRESIAKHGLSKIHRQTFCKNILYTK